MTKFSLAKIIVSLVLVVWYFIMPQYSFSGYGIGTDETLSGHVLYSFSHANVWHLSANILCLWMLPCELHLLFAIIAAVLCSFLPCFIGESTCGFSGVLFAIVGMSWGSARKFKDMLWRNKWWLIIPVFIPHVNALLHVYCLLAGYFFSRWMISGHSGGRRNSGKYKDWL